MLHFCLCNFSGFLRTIGKCLKSLECLKSFFTGQPGPDFQATSVPLSSTRVTHSTGPWPIRHWTAQQEVTLKMSQSDITPRLGISSCRKTTQGLHWFCIYGELYNYFIIYHNVIIEMQCTINVVCLNHSETIPHPWSVESLFSTKLVPGAKKVGDHYSNTHL